MKRICPCESCQGEWPLFESSCRTCCQSLSSRPLLVYALSSQEWFSWNSVLCEGISNLVVSCSCILCGIYEISVSSRSFCLQALELLSTYQFGKLTAWRCDAPPCTLSFAASEVCGDQPMWMTRNRSTSRMPIQSHHTRFIGIVASNDRNIQIVLQKIPFSLGNYFEHIFYNFKGVSQWLSLTVFIFSSMSLSSHWSSCDDHLRCSFPMTISLNRIITWSNALWFYCSQRC